MTDYHNRLLLHLLQFIPFTVGHWIIVLWYRQVHVIAMESMWNVHPAMLLLKASCFTRVWHAHANIRLFASTVLRRTSVRRFMEITFSLFVGTMTPVDRAYCSVECGVLAMHDTRGTCDFTAVLSFVEWVILVDIIVLWCGYYWYHILSRYFASFKFGN